jgi:hypothetical protein
MPQPTLRTPDPEIASNLAACLNCCRTAWKLQRLVVVLADSKRPIGEIGNIERMIPELESLSEVAIRTKRALDPHEVSSLTDLRRRAERRGARFVVDFCLDNQTNAFAVLDGNPPAPQR